MCKKSQEQCKAKTKCKCCIRHLDKKQESGKLGLNEVDNQFEQQLFIINVKGDSTMSLTKDKIKDRIFELEMEQKELKMHIHSLEMENKFYMDCDMFGGTDTTDLEKQIQENNCWIAYYKDRLKDIENEEKYDE